MPTSRTVGAGLAFLGVAIGALLPVFLVLYPAAGLRPGDAGRPEAILPVVAHNPALFIGPGILELLGHAVGAAAMIGLWMRLGKGSWLLTAATFAGLVWMAVDVVDNAIGLQVVPRLANQFAAGDLTAVAAYAVSSLLMDTLRLAGHFGGGLWVVGVSAFCLSNALAPRLLAWTGMVAGAILAANPLVPALLNVSFITLPLWLVLFGVVIARRETVGSRSFVPEPAG